MAKGSMPLVSVVIPTYNRAERLKRALESVFNQTFTDFEIIVVDDGSQDNTEEIIKNMQDPRIRFIKHPRNLGVSAARNTGIKASKGRYIAFLDSDDLWDRKKLEKQLIKIFQERADLCYTSVVFKTEKGKIVRKQVALYSGYIFPILLKKNIIGTASCVMVRQEIFKKVGLFNRNLSYREDYEMWLRIARTSKVAAVAEELTIQIVHEGNRLSHNIHKRINGFEIIINEFLPELNKHPKALSKQMYELGKLYLKTHNPKKAEDCFINSLKTYPSPNSIFKTLMIKTCEKQ